MRTLVCRGLEVWWCSPQLTTDLHRTPTSGEGGSTFFQFAELKETFRGGAQRLGEYSQSPGETGQNPLANLLHKLFDNPPYPDATIYDLVKIARSSAPEVLL